MVTNGILGRKSKFKVWLMSLVTHAQCFWGALKSTTAEQSLKGANVCICWVTQLKIPSHTFVLLFFEGNSGMARPLTFLWQWNSEVVPGERGVDQPESLVLKVQLPTHPNSAWCLSTIISLREMLAVMLLKMLSTTICSKSVFLCQSKGEYILDKQIYLWTNVTF